jgi:hypothetical protein
VPFKANQDRRHHIPKQRHRVTNWAAYDIAVRQRGSLTVWLTEAAIAGWKAEQRRTRGGQPRYSALAITTRLAHGGRLARQIGGGEMDRKFRVFAVAGGMHTEVETGKGR